MQKQKPSKFEQEEEFTLTTHEQDLKDRLLREIDHRERTMDKDQYFKNLAENDEASLLDSEFDFDGAGNFLKSEDGYSLGEQLDYHDLEGKETKNPVPRIIGKTSPKTEILTEGHPSNNERLTIEQRVQKQLRAVTDIMGLDEFGQKHWYYRLKREYIAEEKVRKRLEARKAKKDFRKLLKKYNIAETLAEEENFDAFYDELKNGKQPEEEQRELPKGYMNEEEYRFYGDDHEFMKFHKKTKSNMQMALQELINSSRQTIAKGVLGMHNITVNYIDLNKASSLIIAYWTINSLTASQMPPHLLEKETMLRKDELLAEIEKDKQAILTDNKKNQEEIDELL